MDEKEKLLHDFNLEEYKMAINAHFNISQRITSFFQYMLLIYAAPIFLFNENVQVESFLKGTIFILISCVCFFVIMYVSQLRIESLLYARVVNSMRSYFSNKNGVTVEDLNYYGMLPIQNQKPSYTDSSQFLWIFLSSCVVNAAYLLFGIAQIKPYIGQQLINLFNFAHGIEGLTANVADNLIILSCLIIYVILHIFAYRYMCYKSENGIDVYKQRIGIDIDGVLNEHRDQFCIYYNKMFGASIAPEQLVKIPVSETGLGISEANEREVFNTQGYWETMPPIDDAWYYLKKCHDILGCELFVYTWRDWGKGKFNINKITKTWLKNNKIKYKSINFEKGNYDVPAGFIKMSRKSRFNLSKKHKVKYFVEDELKKAIKLSRICKYVFLYDQPYNQTSTLPINIIRVTNWHDIYDYIKTYS